MAEFLPNLDRLTLGFGVWVLVFALCFLAGLPLLGERHRAGEDITPQLKKNTWAILGLSVLLTIFGFWVYDVFILPVLAA